ncbi:Uncharacterised protein [uncultured Clostridium sp.]|uniref:hypothetical protein n=1 Tax=uncultured Clostridium sp. TaxID=59620 RepID=UPI00082109E4|nr:hypothetical protein [uncultured Clostridium sp.]SCJ54622.1 Uncharacterised protein [uncultured Clostridium sp.]
MHIKNKKGFALLEVLIIVNILIVLISLYARQNLINIRKSKYYMVKEDIMTLTIEEEQFIKEAEINVSSDISLVTKLKENGVDESVNITSTNNKNLYIEILKKDIYLIHKKGSEKKYRKLEYEIVSEPIKVDIRPTRYVTAYTNK